MRQFISFTVLIHQFGSRCELSFFPLIFYWCIDAWLNVNWTKHTHTHLKAYKTLLFKWMIASIYSLINTNTWINWHSFDFHKCVIINEERNRCVSIVNIFIKARTAYSLTFSRSRSLPLTSPPIWWIVIRFDLLFLPNNAKCEQASESGTACAEWIQMCTLYGKL